MSLTTKQTLGEQAIEFRRVFKRPNVQSANGRTMQRTLIVEEFKEFLDAEALVGNHPGLRAECLKELADLVYVCFQYAANMRWDLDEALDRVHKSNLSKLDDNGNAILRSDGKVVKSKNYKPPYLDDLV